MARGAKPGERRGGRKKGTPNRATLEREQVVADDRHSKGMKLAKEVMSEAMHFFRSLAAKHQLNGPEPNEQLFDQYLSKAAEVAAKLAPYESPRLQATTIATDKPIEATLTVRFV